MLSDACFTSFRGHPVAVLRSRTPSFCLAIASLLAVAPAHGQVAPLPRAAAPVLSLASGTYSSSQSVSITDTTPGAVIYYTTNGAYPGTTSSVYSAPISVSSSEIIVAVAIAPGYDNSPWAVGRYFISTSATRWTYSIAGNGFSGYSGDGGLATLSQLSEPSATALDTAGNLYIADKANHAIRKINTQTGIITTIAGTGVAGHAGDGGPATSAELNSPCCIAVDPAGNIFIAGAPEVPSTLGYVVRRIDAVTGTISSYAGALGGTVAFAANATRLNQIQGLATDGQGNLYIDEGFEVQKVTAATGLIATVAGNGYTYGENGPATNALFYSFGFAVDQSGNIYIADETNNAVRKVNATTGIITTLAGGPSATAIWGDGGPATAARLNFPETVGVDQNGNVYIADALNYAIRKIDAGTGIISTIAGDGDYQSAGGDGDPSSSVGVGYLEYLTVDPSGDLFYSDLSSRIRKVILPTVPPASLTAPPVFSLSAGTYATPQTASVSDSAAGASIYLSFSNDPPDTTWSGYFGPIDLTGSATITAIAVAPGSLPSAPVQRAYTITIPPSSVISTVAGVGYYGNSPSGLLATSAVFGNPEAMAVDQAGNFYFTEYGNNQVRKVSASTGIETIVAGTGTQGYNGDGIAATSAQLASPYGLAVDKAGNLYIADSGNGRVRKIDAGTGMISTVAGGGSNIAGDGGPATSASLGFPRSVAVDAAGNLYIPDSYAARIRKVDASTGIISTIVGGTADSFSGDGGPATAATISGATGVAFDGNGNLYINDSGNQRIRKVDANTGIISTIAGNGSFATPKDGTVAIDSPISPVLGSLTADAAGNIYFSTYANSVARVDAATGLLTTAAGNHYEGSTGDGGDATTATVNGPQGVAVDKTGNLLIAEFTGRVRKVTFLSPAATPSFSLAAGSYTGVQTVTISSTSPNASIYYTTDGSTPNTGSTLYSGPVAISQSETLEAIAISSGFSESSVASAAYTITIPTPTVAVASSASSAFLSNPVTFTANLTGSPGTPTGTVTFFDGSTQLGTGTLSAGSATYTTSALAAGTHTITVSYSGDANFKPATSTATTETIVDFTITTPTGSSSSATISAGATATYALAVTPSSGATTPAAISLAVTGNPTGSTSAFSTTSVAAGSSATSVTLSIGVPASPALRTAFNTPRPKPANRLPIALAVLLLPLVGLRRAGRALGNRVMLLLVTLAGAGAIFGCGGGGGSNTTPPPQPQTYTLTVTATAGALNHTTTLTLTVQ